MLFRNLLLALGVACLLAGVLLAGIWLNHLREGPAVSQQPAAPRAALLVAKHALPAGTLMRPDDFGWRELPSGEIASGLVRGQTAENEYLGAITRRDFAADEPLNAVDLVKPTDRRFLAAVLKPGTRAVSISVDASQSASGLVLPGDHVDVILTQSFNDAAADPARKSVGETVLHDIRVIAVDQSLGVAARPGTDERGLFNAEAKVPKTVTLELNERQAESLFVAIQLGRLNLAVRALAIGGPAATFGQRQTRATWASDVSPALIEVSRKQMPSGSTVENAVRRPPMVTQ